MWRRHFTRLCRACEAPMARQEDSCWRCGSLWTADDLEPTPRRSAAVVAAPPTRARAEWAHAARAAQLDDDRWADDGGPIRFGGVAAVPAAGS